MSSVASSPILTSAASSTAEGVGAETASGPILRLTWPDPHTPRTRRTPHQSSRRRPAPRYGRLGPYLRLQCYAAVGHFLRGLAYGTGLGLAGALVSRMRGLW
ncbi:hypothetical protein VO63_04110 [Streptomyces showdoensis]|uniref:Uncharacterized protein n=1 Tax=Streptomyces showdoensis TaxID=68268 RepID=A0A2P2GVV1_STREW|nr:hypothetical protein VO63_04110 [Streptomyces showdoensis]